MPHGINSKGRKLERYRKIMLKRLKFIPDFKESDLTFTRCYVANSVNNTCIDIY